MDFVTDPGNTRGHLSLFSQTVHKYWIVKCLISKAMQSFHPTREKPKPKMLELLQDIDIQLQHIKVTQYQAIDRIGRINDRIGRMEKQVQLLQQADMLGSTAKDSAPIESSNA